MGRSITASLLRMEKLEDPHETHSQLHVFGLFLEWLSQSDVRVCRARELQLPSVCPLEPTLQGTARSMYLSLEDVFLNHRKSLFRHEEGCGGTRR